MKTPPFINFGGDEIELTDIADARIVVLPLCYEHAPSYRGGSAFGPLHILDASVQLERMDEQSLIDWGNLGIYTKKPLFPSDDPKTAVMQMKDAAYNILKEKNFLLSLGGDHAITIGPVMAAASIHKNIGVLQIDAHLDLRNEWNGSLYNHACVMRRIMEDVRIPFVQVGIRSLSPEEASLVKSKKLAPFYAHRIDPLDDNWIDKIVSSLPDTVYLTIDLDGLDPSVIPGTGTPEPGGLTYRQVVNLIAAVFARKKVVAADINELAVIPGSNVSEFTAAKIAAKIFVHAGINLK